MSKAIGNAEHNQIIRRQALAARRAMAAAEVTAKSRRIADHLCRLPWLRSADTVLTYLAYGNEVDLAELTAWLWEAGKRVLVPICLPDRPGVMIASELLPSDLTAMRKTAFGVMEPVHIRRVEPSEIDLVLVPGVAFDRRGNRLGHGAGYYDRYLVDLPSAAQTVGIGYELQLSDEIRPEAWDQPLSALCTESGVMYF